MKITWFTIILSIVVLASCKANRLKHEENIITLFKELDIKSAIEWENKKDAKDITPDHLIEISEGIYPNNKRFDLATPKTFRSMGSQNLQLQTEYFYDVKDSLVRVILYQWDYLKEDDKKFRAQQQERLFKIFQIKFDSLARQLTKEYGSPFLKKIEQQEMNVDTFRDDLKFKRADGLNAYLFMFGNNENNFRQIRLAIYSD
jgi:hypothetical protein